MNGYFDYDEYDFAEDYDFSPVDAPQSESTGTCDGCRLLPGESVTVGGLTVVCACWMGQGASEEACHCGPEEGDAAGDEIPD
ncbi:hypothetical protein AB0I82_23785 [Streptomyces sp. NPDC050315]|uniref:hypothetical protein n=1 Tax=Streptomyces sp. NPDC050315 TaxID=3155039 RepID=UPI003426B107